MEGELCDGAESMFHACGGDGRCVVRGAVPGVRDQPGHGLPVAAALAGGRQCRALRAVAGAAGQSPRGGARAPGGLSRAAAPASALGAGEGAGGAAAASTIGELFAREGLTTQRKCRRRAPPGGPLFAADAPNEVWATDFKGWFRTGDGVRCDTLTLADACSRYLLRCQAVARPDAEHVWPILDAAFREYGLPLRLRSDNGPPFATTGAGGLSRLAVLVIKAGVRPERIAPGKPQENGRLERLHLTLLQDTASPPAASLQAQAKRFQKFRRSYNEERPHAALDNATPADCYQPSPRRWDGRLRSPEPEADAMRRVKANGTISWRGKRVFVSEALEAEPVALAEVEGGRWEVRYGPILLGFLADRGQRLIRPQKADGLVDNARALPTGPTAATTTDSENGR